MQQFSTLAAQWNHLRSFKIYGSLDPAPRSFNVIGLGCGLGTGIFKSSLSVCNVQPRLKTTIAGVCSQIIPPLLTRQFFTAT